MPKKKDPAAVALGRKGGLKGGKARAKAMTPEQRKESAQKAAAARWGKPKTWECICEIPPPTFTDSKLYLKHILQCQSALERIRVSGMPIEIRKVLDKLNERKNL